MSLEIFDDEVKRKHLSGGSIGRGASVHESAAQQLLYPHVTTVEENADGSTTTKKEIDVSARTELPAPANTTVLHEYGGYLAEAFGRPNRMNSIETTYEIKMISKSRQGRKEYAMVATGAALNSSNNESEDILKKVQMS